MQLLRLKEIIKERHIVSKEFAKELGINPVTLSRIANGISFPSGELLSQIAKSLDMDVKDLFNSTKPVEPGKPIYVEENGKYIKIGELKV